MTVALNAAPELPLTLESIAAQDYDDLEVIVVDGSSWDNTAAVLASYVDVIDSMVVREDAGIYYAMNDALDEVTKDYVIFMNAGDTFYCADAVSRMVRGLTGAPDIFYGNHVYVAGRREVLKRSASFDLIAERLAAGTIDGAWQESIPGHQATFCRADLLRTLRFDTRLRVCADHDLLFRAYDQDASMLYIDEAVAHYHGGGFSAQMGEWTRLECAATYRRFSGRPDAVDRYFFPTGSPFQPHTARTGLKLEGFVPADSVGEGHGASGDWVLADRGRLLSPDQPSTGVELAGFNEIEDQRVELRVDDRLVASIDIPPGGYRVEVTFDRPLPGRSTVDLRPLCHRSTEHADIRLGFLLRSFRFQTTGAAPDEGLLVGECLDFRRDSLMDILPLMGEGWAQPEEGHVWSLGPLSDLWLKASTAAGRLRFSVGGNPHVAGGYQTIEFRVNGEVAARVVSDHGSRLTVEIDCTRAPWLPGRINHVSFALDVIARPPAVTGDSRLLGMCLWKVEILASE